MTPSRLFILAVFALFMMLGSTVMAESSSSDSSGSNDLLSAKEVDSAKAKYLKEKLAMEKKLMAEKANEYKDYFSDSKSVDDEEDKILNVLSDRIPAEKLEKIKGLDAATRAKVLAELKLNFKTVLVKKAEFDAKQIMLESRLAEIETANGEADDSKRLIAKLRLANQLCERIEASTDDSTDDSCRAILAKLAAVRDKTRLTSDEMKDVEATLKETRVVWVQKHYSRWLAQSEQLQTKLQRIENKLASLVDRAKGANLENADTLATLSQKFNRIQAAYDSKVAAMKTAYASFEAAPSYKGALQVRAAAAKVKIFGKFAVHAVNRFVYLYHHMGASESDDGITITATDAKAIVDAIPSVDEIELQADAEVAATIATADVPASELVSTMSAAEIDDSGTDSVSDSDDSAEDETDDSGTDSDSDLDDSDDDESGDDSGSNDDSNDSSEGTQ